MIPIVYSQLNFVQRPDRAAFINARMRGIPFQGYDSLRDGKGSMRGFLPRRYLCLTKEEQTWIRRVWSPSYPNHY